MNHSASPSELLEHLSTQQSPNFNYGVLKTETRMVIQQLTCEIKTLMRRNAQDIIDIGQKLVEVKQHLGRGSFIKWLKSEFNWSVSSATKFMQVWEQFKFVNFKNLNITASALYLIAAPSTSKEARAEALERASFGENITYTKAKQIVCQHKKNAKPKLDRPLTIYVCAKTIECEDSKSIEPVQNKTPSAFCAPEVLTEKEVETEPRSLSEQSAITINRNKDIPDDSIQIPASILNQAAISLDISDAVTTEIAIGIKKLMPEELALVIRKSANNGLSNRHLEVLITQAQQVLNQRRHYISHSAP